MSIIGKIMGIAKKNIIMLKFISIMASPLSLAIALHDVYNYAVEVYYMMCMMSLLST